MGLGLVGTVWGTKFCGDSVNGGTGCPAFTPDIADLVRPVVEVRVSAQGDAARLRLKAGGPVGEDDSLRGGQRDFRAVRKGHAFIFGLEFHSFEGVACLASHTARSPMARASHRLISG